MYSTYGSNEMRLNKNSSSSPEILTATRCWAELPSTRLMLEMVRRYESIPFRVRGGSQAALSTVRLRNNSKLRGSDGARKKRVSINKYIIHTHT